MFFLFASKKERKKRNKDDYEARKNFRRFPDVKINYP